MNNKRKNENDWRIIIVECLKKKSALFLILIIILFFILSCGTSETINKHDHNFGQRPSKIIWIQIAGLAEEHLAMLRFSTADAISLTNFENTLCVGKMWNYNLLKLRPSARDGFFSQITGKGLVTGTCEDYKQTPIWNYLQISNGMKTGIFETSDLYNLYAESSKCVTSENDFNSRPYFWEMTEAPDVASNSFHSLEKTIFNGPGVYYDKSCKKSSCYSGLLENINSIFRRFVTKPKERFLFLIRDFTYQKFIKEKNIIKAKEVLIELDSIVAYFNEIVKHDPEMLLLITSSEAQSFELPNYGKEWAEFDLNGKNIFYHKADLMSPVFASGARAENFCGIFEETDIMARIITEPKRKNIKEIFKDLF